MSNKTIKAISINPTLFSVGAIKTKKNREKKAVVKQIPVGKSPHGVWTLNHASRD
jgi:hypothetical protein